MRFKVRFTGADTGSEGVYEFEDRAELLKGPADELVEAFFAYANRTIFQHERVTYELNGALRHAPKDMVVGMGVMHMQGHDDGLPFTIVINESKAG